MCREAGNGHSIACDRRNQNEQKSNLFMLFSRRCIVMPLSFPHRSIAMTSNMSLGIFIGKYQLQKWVLAGLLALGTQLGIAAEPEVEPGQVVSAIEDVFGVTPGAVSYTH